MARRKSKKSKTSTVQHQLPAGFWAQVMAILMIALALLLIVAWFNAGGPVLQALHKINTQVFGNGAYILPIVLIYLGFEIFRSDDNRLSIATYVSSFILMALMSGFFATIFEDNKAGGFIGGGTNRLMASLATGFVAALVYILLITITTLFMVKASPFLFIKRLQEIFANQKPGKIEGFKPKEVTDASSVEKEHRSEFQLVEGVPTTSSEKKSNHDSSGLQILKPKTNSVSETKSDKKETTALVSVYDPNWKQPPLDILNAKESPADAGDVKQNAEIIRNTLHEFNFEVDMTGANVGPKVTQYTLTPPSGVKLTKIAALETNIALNLAAQAIRIEAPIPGKKAVGIEVPNIKSAGVCLRRILESPTWFNNHDKLNFVVGRDISGDAVVESLGEMPHLLIAGQTGSGKSVMINTLLASLLYRNSPSDLKLILVDPKQVEMAPYEDIPHLLTPIINDPAKTISALKWAVNEMERRYQLLASVKKRDINSYNEYISQQEKTVEIADQNDNLQQHNDGAMPYIVIVIDEMADLMMVASKDVESLIVRLAQKARAVGIHLVLATQRPSVNVVTGLIKANVPARIAFTVASQVDSKTILDKSGAEKLLGKGDMLIVTPKMAKPRRIQGALVTDDEIMKITDFLREQLPPQYNEEITMQDVQIGGRGIIGNLDNADDAMLRQAAEVVIDAGKASTTLLQLRLKLGYARAARIMGELEERGVIGPQNGSKPREVLVSSIDDIL
ncbi:MAG: DNA translocase FtsK 4TM domain-containing protein [Candidatus Saccharibacteria bacterium]|nr:DNA translocase FtsK 4TM domain-containing protein [Candidatus Saccharibacteria bacterium]